MNLLKKLEDTIARLSAKGAGQGEIAAAIAAVVNSPVIALIVAATPTKTDDAILETLKTLFPA